MPMIWNAEADAKVSLSRAHAQTLLFVLIPFDTSWTNHCSAQLFAAVIKTSENISFNYTAIAELMGPGKSALPLSPTEDTCCMVASFHSQT